MSSGKKIFLANFWRRVKTTVVSLAILQSVATTLPVSAQTTDTDSTVTIGYTELLASVKENRVQKIDLESNGLAAEAVLKDGRKVRVDLLARDGNTELMKALRENGVDTAVKAPQQPTLIWQLVSTFFVPMLLIFILLMVLRRLSNAPGGPGQTLSFGKTKARFSPEAKTGIMFEDVAGIDTAKEE